MEALKASDLRIGNWIIEPGQDYDKPFQIFSIYHEDKNNKVNGLPISLMQPIPLTEDWLIRAGFVKSGSFSELQYHWSNDLWNIYIEIESYCLITHRNYTGGVKLDNIKYLHQLQNLYFALTGSELEINY